MYGHSLDLALLNHIAWWSTTKPYRAEYLVALNKAEQAGTVGAAAE